MDIQINTGQPEEIIPIEERIKNMEPMCSGLYPHEVLVLAYAHKYTTGENKYPGFWYYKYGIKDVDAILHSLFDRGYIEVASLKATLKNSTQDNLKKTLKEHGLKVSGKKEELVQRLIDNIPDDMLNSIFNVRYYIPSESGKEILEKENYIKYIHDWKTTDLDIWKFSKIMHSIPPMPFEKVLARYLMNQSKEYLARKSYGLYRNCRFYMSELAHDKKEYEAELRFLSEVIYYDLSGLTYIFDGQFYGYAHNFFPYDSSYATIPVGIIGRIRSCQKILNISDEELSAKLSFYFSETELPFQVFTLNECVAITIFELRNEKDKLRTLYKVAEEKYCANPKYREQNKNVQSLDELKKQIMEELKAKAEEDDRIYDPEHEEAIAARLAKLDDLSRSEFYRLRTNRRNDGVLSARELDLLTLEAMEKSYYYHKGKN